MGRETGKQEIKVSRGALSTEEIELVAGKLVKCGYAVKITKKDKTVDRCIQFWYDKEE